MQVRVFPRGMASAQSGICSTTSEIIRSSRRGGSLCEVLDKTCTRTLTVDKWKRCGCCPPSELNLSMPRTP